MSKPTARQVWRQLLDEAGEDEIQAVLRMTPEQVDAELAGQGMDLAKERANADRFLEELASGALEARLGIGDPGAAPAAEKPASAAVAVGAAHPAPGVLADKRKRPRTAMVLVLAATVAAGTAAGAIWVATHHAPAPTPPSPQPPPSPSPSSTEEPLVVPDLVAAADWRAKAVAACDAQRWSECLHDLDHARTLDPAGDDAPLVKSTRDKAIAGIEGKKNP